MVVRGKVQGVFYRVSARDAAEERGITGWVRNRQDGSVEIIASGEEEAVRSFGNWCRQGPKGAHVTGVEWEEQAYQPFEAFTVLR